MRNPQRAKSDPVPWPAKESGPWAKNVQMTEQEDRKIGKRWDSSPLFLSIQCPAQTPTHNAPRHASAPQKGAGMKRKALVLDIDGTLTNSRKDITLATKTAIQAIMEKGHLCVLASGRPAPGMRRYERGRGRVKYSGEIL